MCLLHVFKSLWLYVHFTSFCFVFASYLFLHLLQLFSHFGLGHVIFQLRRRKENQKQRSKSRPRAVSHDDLRKTHEHSVTQVDKLPYLVELNPRGK